MGKNDRIAGMAARDIRLAYSLEEMFESALGTDGEVYVLRVRSEAGWPKDWPKTIEIE